MSGRYLVLILIAVAACRRPARLDVDLSGLTEVVQRRVAHAAGEPRFDAAVAAVGAAIAADPAVAKAGAALFATLANDPELARSTEAIMAALQSSPRFQGALRDLQAAHLTAAQPELDALLGARIDANLASAAWRDAWTNGWRPFAARLDVGGVPPALAAALRGRLDAYVERHTPRWADRLAELNGGAPPPRARATELYLEHAWSEPRLARFMTALLEAPVTRAECAAVLRRLLALTSVRALVHDAATSIAGDAGARAAAVAVVAELFVEHPAANRLAGALGGVLLAPTTVQAVSTAVTRAFADPAVGQILVDGVEHLRADPRIAAAVDDLLDHW